MGFLNNLGPVEWIVIIAVVVLIFGGGLVKGVAKRAGETTKEVKKAKQIFEEASKDKPEDKTTV